MSAPWSTDAQVKDYLARAMGQTDSTDLAGKFTDLITEKNQAAARWIAAKLSGKGYTAAQIDSWAQRVEFNKYIAAYWVLEAAGLYQQDNLTHKGLKIWLDELEKDELALLDGDGVLIEPGTEDRMCRAGRMTAEDFNTADTDYTFGYKDEFSKHW